MSELSRNEKVAGAVIAATLAGSALSGCTEININKNYNNPNNTQDALIQKAPEQQIQIDPISAPITLIKTETKDFKELTPENLQLKFGEYGVFRTYFNWDTGMYHLGISEDYRVEEGTKTLEDLKRNGGAIGLTNIPFDMAVNVSGGDEGKFYVNGEEWNLGNPAKSKEGEFVIEKGSSFEGVWEAENDSAGLEIMISPTGSFDDFEYPETVRPNYQTEEEQTEFTPLDLETNLQKLGTYKWVYDSIQEKYILQIAEKHQVKKGEMDLEDVKENGGTFFMSFPWETRVNSIVGEVKINGNQVLNGNPVYDKDGNVINKEYMIPANTLIQITYQANNASNGFQAEIDWPKK
jgi:hypothetical protein